MLDKYSVAPVDTGIATRMVVENHYLHRKGPCSRAFGLYDAARSLKGVVTYGVPASVPLVKGLLGPENRNLVGELTRLWVADDVPKNGESFLIGRTVRQSGFEVLVSFADTSMGHVGVVYQATNWLYTGLSASHKDWVLIGNESRHTRHTWDEWGGIEGAKRAIPERMMQVERPRKHRYVFINAKGTRRKKLMSQLRYPVLPYPKRGDL